MNVVWAVSATLAYDASYVRYMMLEGSSAGGVSVSQVSGDQVSRAETYGESVSLEGLESDHILCPGGWCS